MKIYHTETQKDYDALMVELEDEDYVWASGRKPTESKDWVDDKENTGVVVKKRMSRGCIGVLKSDYPDTPIIKYKARADNKMKFTKENVFGLFREYRINKNGIHRLDDLEREIMNLEIVDLDDAPEKVVVPQFMAEWCESQSDYNIYRMIEVLHNGGDLEETVLAWLRGNYPKYGLIDRFDLLALIRINGYTIEPEQLYYIPLPHLETSDGIQQVLSKRDTYFASRLSDNLKQRFTKAELEQVPEIYKPYATLIEEEE